MPLEDFPSIKLPKEKVWGLRPRLLLQCRTPKPMHGVVPRVILGKRWWDIERTKAFESTDYHCRACGVHKTVAQGPKYLEGHEIFKADYVLGRWEYVEAVGLCNYCHSFIHIGRQQALLEKGKVTRFKFDSIVNHGNRILEDYGLTKEPPFDGPTVPWSQWRMILNGNEYPPKFKNLEEWAKFHGYELEE